MDNQKETERLTTQAMADCMDMVRGELVEAGVIGADVAPMFLADAVLSYVAALGADLRSTLAELTAVQRKLIDANAEIVALLLARDQTAVPAVPEPAETRMDTGLPPPSGGGPNSLEFGGINKAVTVPATPEQAIAFIGNQCEVIQEAEQPEDWRFQLTAHDLLSAFRWWFDDVDSVTITKIHPDWQLVPKVPTISMREAAGYAVSGRWRPTDVTKSHAMYTAMLAAAPSEPEQEVYTCIGKGGRYEQLGMAFGAGECREQRVVVYRDMKDGELYFRTPGDFATRMTRIGVGR